MWLKACPRCRGDLYARHQPEGLEITCIQCSRIYTSAQLMRALPPVEAEVPAEIVERVDRDIAIAA
jgi:hypothetical protein